MDANRQSGDIHDEHKPAVAVRFIGHILPFQNEPEHNGRQRRGVGIDLTFDGREPECIAECVYQRTHQSGSLNGDKLRHGQLTPVGDKQTACKMGDTPEQEKDTRRRQQGAHRVHHLRHLSGIAGKLREEIGRQHEERCPRRVADFHLVTCGDKLRTVPERGCRLDCGAIDEGGNQEREPPEDIVHQLELFH